MHDDFYIEVECQQRNQLGQSICGDVFMSRKLKDEGRTILVLSDGLGSGVKANVLATLTSSMILNYMKVNKDIRKAAEVIMKTLPVCSKRKAGYSTFTIVEIECDGETRIICYDNPDCLILRGLESFQPECEELHPEGEANKGKILYSYRFKAQKEDRIIFCSDGVTNSGMGSKRLPFGWGMDNVDQFARGLIRKQPYISARRLGNDIVERACANNSNQPKDDTSCAVLYYREPRNLMICTGPPYEKTKDAKLVRQMQEFEGTKIVCGGTTAGIVSRELQKPIEVDLNVCDSELPPVSFIEGVDLVTEGILTLGKVHRILNNYNQNTVLRNGPADRIVKLLLESDKIFIINGTKINVAHQDPKLPVELEIRRTVVKNIVALLEEKFLKEVDLSYI
ncbi:SpoIIE family protein phosphatase [Marinifilum caeruleilacunae]|uniref:Stage II sporulation protein E n=1 Tax=Marinifilum caeruleilacunae TaxID=2499076 RepID=A0ABX1WXP6_9BACT|nr:SpoIIE family protein phosphatase [Marinifilum caeruleilacunae]NOU60771.1 stage II sporulation protein E [Marinifilum caeruleilacunae]